MNTYDTYCEQFSCRNVYLQQAPDIREAVRNLIANGWRVEARGTNAREGFVSYCPQHAEHSDQYDCGTTALMDDM